MRTLCLLLITTTFASAAGLAGKYKMSAQLPSGDERKFELVLTETGGKLGGVVNSDQGSLTLEDVVVAGNDVTFKIPLDQGPLPVKVSFDGDKVKGSGTMGDGTAIPMSGMRDGAAAASGSVAGKWKCVTKSSDGQEIRVTIELAQSGPNVTGQILTENGDAAPISDGKMTGSDLFFKVPTEDGAWEVKVTLAGTELKGTAKSPAGVNMTTTASKI